MAALPSLPLPPTLTNHQTAAVVRTAMVSAMTIGRRGVMGPRAEPYLNDAVPAMLGWTVQWNLYSPPVIGGTS